MPENAREFGLNLNGRVVCVLDTQVGVLYLAHLIPNL
jgi:hypothetical protein